MKRSTLIFLFAALLATQGGAEPAPPAASDGSVYDRVYAALSALPERRVGSENYAKAFDTVEAELKAAGLATHRQTFDSLAQVTERLSFTYGGKPVDGVRLIDNGPASFVLPEPLRGPAVFVGSGSLREIDGKDLRGAVAVIDLERPGADVEESFVHGARAAVLVGGPAMDQWRLSKTAFLSVSLVPRVYVDRAAAEAAGLLEADGSREIEIDARATLRDVAGCNLWAELPAASDAAPEVVVLSATLDTYGLTPDYAPELRGAANCALLAEVASRLAARGPLPRRVVVAFFGSRYGGQEGPRFFYHAVDMANVKVNDKKSDTAPTELRFRAERYRLELDRTVALLEQATAPGANLIDAGGELRLRLKRELVTMANTVRAAISDLRLEAAAARAEGTPEGDARAAEIDERIGDLAARRAACNELRTQINKGRFNGSATLPEGVVAEYESRHGKGSAAPLLGEVYRLRSGDVVDVLRSREGELRRMRDNIATWIELSETFGDNAFVGHFDLDFAAADRPWAFSMNDASGLYRFSAPSTGDYRPYAAALREVYYGADGLASRHLPSEDGAPPPEASWASAPLYRDALSCNFKPFSLSMPRQRFTPTALADALALPGFQLITVGDPLAHDNLPLAEPCDLSGLADQMTELFDAIVRSPEISRSINLTPELLEQRLLYLEDEGVNYLNYAPGSTDNEGLPRRAVAFFGGFRRPVPLPGASAIPRTRILANGHVYVPYIGRNVAITSHMFDNVAVGYDESGAVDRISVDSDAHGIIATPVHLFYAHGGLAFNNGYPPDPLGGDMYHAETLQAVKDSPIKTHNTVRLDGRSEFFADRPDAIKVIGSHGDMLLGSVAWSNASERVRNSMGLGVPLDADSRLHADNAAQGANDAFLLNQARLEILRERNIARDDLERLHADAQEHVRAAEEARENREWSVARAHEVFATCLENRVYSPLRGVTEDLVEAVVLLLLLNIPFAFAMERLIFGFPSIYKQILGFIGFFLATFAILYVTHPAFSLASAPIVIFLAFVIIMLGVITTAIMMGKIKEEIRKLQGLSSTVHGVASESSTTLSAILIGIAGMRNRPLKTFLTCATVVLLTFTILVFASFSSEQGVVETNLGSGSGPTRIELHRLSFLDIDDEYAAALSALYGDRYDVARRGGLFLVPTRSTDVGNTPAAPERFLLLPSSGETIEMGAVMGADAVEFSPSGVYADLAPDFGNEGLPHPPVYLPPSATNSLTRLRVGDELRLNGVPFSFAGFFPPDVLRGLSTIDDLRAVPPDFRTTLANSGSQATSGASMETFEEMSSGAFEWFAPDRIAIAPMDALRAAFEKDCMVNFLVMYPHADAEGSVDADAETIAPAFQGAVHVKSANGARQLFFSNTVQGSGFSDVVIPLLLGGLIIFSSLMGSIVAREREIFTYSALGLAPVDVGALFFAESAVYSVIGGMGGYLLSQLVAKLLDFLGSLGWFTPPEMNFSSLTSVCTILIVMAVVMLSTIFPALRASKSANPGVARKWRMPRPKGDKLEFVFPFTVNSVDFAGILSFIREHFENHADATLGAFAARDVRLFEHPDPKHPGRRTVGIEANVSLAPFDLGIFQKFRMYSQEFEIEGIDEVVVDLTRIGGSPVSWQRSNRAFAAELREQFLLWRSLPIETVEHYRSATKTELGLS